MARIGAKQPHMRYIILLAQHSTLSWGKARVSRLRFRREGLILQRYLDEVGNLTDDILFSMLRSDWEHRDW